MSKSMKKIVQRMNKNDGKLSKVCVSLAKKSIRNEKNKLIIRCSFCSNTTELPFKKKNRLKPPKLNDSEVNTSQNNSKKKKKKSRDKFAGLNISVCTPESKIKKKDNDKISRTPVIPVTPVTPVTPVRTSVTMPVKKKLSSITKIEKPKKPKKLNVQRLKQIVAHNTNTSTKRNSLHSFLAELR